MEAKPPPPPKPNPAGAPPPVPKIDTRSSSGFVDVPESKLAAAGVWEKTSVAARPEGCCPSIAGVSSKSLDKQVTSIFEQQRPDQRHTVDSPLVVQRQLFVMLFELIIAHPTNCV